MYYDRSVNKHLVIILAVCCLVVSGACQADVQNQQPPTVAPTLNLPTIYPTATITSTPEPTKTGKPAPTQTTAPSPTAKSPRCETEGETWRSPTDDMIQICVPTGFFQLGSDLAPDEQPVQQPFVNAFWLDQVEITNRMYARCVSDGSCAPPENNTTFTDPAYQDHPVVQVSWFDARDYCSWAGRRLPTEAEWEKAARGTDGRTYPWGNSEPDSELANYADAEHAGIVKVGSYPASASPYGALDLTGNVWEWVEDWYNAYEGGDPNTSSFYGGFYRVMRGGSFREPAEQIRTSVRSHLFPSYGKDDLGFRCALSP